jgi:hypothetical protein
MVIVVDEDAVETKDHQQRKRAMLVHSAHDFLDHE